MSEVGNEDISEHYTGKSGQ